MYRAIAALALASISAPSLALTSANSWWERVSVSVAGDGKTSDCRYETSLSASAAQDCSVDGGASAKALSAGSGTKDQYTRITFERRFTPGMIPQAETLKAGETLLGGQVLAIGIDARGAVKRCKIVASTGAVTPQYGCDQAAVEKFEASASADKAPSSARSGYMTILVYGHSEHMV